MGFVVSPPAYTMTLYLVYRRILQLTSQASRLTDDHRCLSSQVGGIVPLPSSSNLRFFTYLILLCIMLLCTLKSEFISVA